MCDIGRIKGFHFRKCDSQQGHIAVMWKKKKLWLCKKCWNKLSDSDWGKEK